MLYKIDKETFEEYISMKKIELGKDVVEHLATIRDDIDDADTKRFLQGYINKFSEEYRICTNCFNDLEPIVIKEHHSELAGNPYESLVDGYRCENCGNRYE